MIDDWVCVRSNDGEDTHNFKIRTISEIGVNSGSGFVGFDEDLELITLTEEILEKNGFKKDRDYGYFIGQSNSGYYIYFNNNHLSIQAGYDVIEFAWCEYVHELQHALKLCGIKKDIVL